MLAINLHQRRPDRRCLSVGQRSKVNRLGCLTVKRHPAGSRSTFSSVEDVFPMNDKVVPYQMFSQILASILVLPRQWRAKASMYSPCRKYSHCLRRRSLQREWVNQSLKYHLSVLTVLTFIFIYITMTRDCVPPQICNQFEASRIYECKKWAYSIKTGNHLFQLHRRANWKLSRY